MSDPVHVDGLGAGMTIIPAGAFSGPKLFDSDVAGYCRVADGPHLGIAHGDQSVAIKVVIMLVIGGVAAAVFLVGAGLLHGLVGR